MLAFSTPWLWNKLSMFSDLQVPPSDRGMPYEKYGTFSCSWISYSVEALTCERRSKLKTPYGDAPPVTKNKAMGNEAMRHVLHFSPHSVLHSLTCMFIDFHLRILACIFRRPANATKCKILCICSFPVASKTGGGRRCIAPWASSIED